MGSGTMRSAAWLLAVVGLFVGANPVSALITRLTALADFLDEATVIVTAKVDSLDATRPAMTLAVEEVLKGKPAFKKMPVLLEGDARARKLKEGPDLLRRLGDGLPVVVFINKAGADQIGFVYTNGTWFSITGRTVAGEVRWAWTHLEPNLRRTFKGTTAEMARTVREGLSGKRKPPPPDAREKPGLGPEAPKKASRLRRRLPEEAGPQLAVVPTVIIGGPLALLAMLFPTVFGGWRRWLVLLSTAGTTSTLFTLHWWFGESLVGSRWGTSLALWVAMSLVNVAGLAWAWRRHLASVQTGEAPLLAGRVERLLLLVVSLLGVATVAACRHLGQPLLSPLWLPVVAFIAAFWAATAYVLWTWLRGPRLVPALASEAVVLLGLVVASVGLTPVLASGGPAAALGGSAAETTVEPAWAFRLPAPGAISSTPVAVGERVYLAAAIDKAFRPYGVLYCLDRATGAVVWSFDDGKKMKQVHSTPTVVGDRLYIGEGFHQDYDCKVYCINAADGTKVWEHACGSHTESTPFVVGGRVYVGAGDDGIYCLEAATGKKVWNFHGFHIDAGPLVVGGRVFVGCGVGDAFKQTVLFCLDAKTGGVVWRMPVDHPVWSRPVVADGLVYAAAGNGRLNESDDNPAGAVLCLKAANGEVVWKRQMPGGVLGRLVVDGKRVYAGCGDGCVHALWKDDGRPAWRRDLGSAVVTGPGVERLADGSTTGPLYVAAVAGVVACLDRRSGQPLWSRDLVEQTKVEVQLISNPVVDVRRDGDGREIRRLYLGVTIQGSARVGELRCYAEALGPGSP